MKLFSFIVSIQPIALFLQGAYLVDGLVQYTNFEHRIKSCEESHPYYNNRDTVFCRKSHSLSRHWNISGRNRPYNPDINDVTDMNYNQPRKRGLFRTDRQFHYDDSSIQHSAIFNPLLILFQLKRLLPKSKALIQGSLIPMIPNVFTTRKKVVKSIFFFTLTVLLFNSMRDMMQTKKRQSVDPTSEWGRYADYPSIRGKALFALMGKMTFWIILVKLINILPDSIFSRRKKMNSIENNSVKNARDLHNGGSSSSACDDYSWAEEKATKIREYSGEKMAEGLLRLGPLYIKIGQIISCRDKLLPEEWKKALERLQDRVPAKSGQEAFDLAYQAYDGNSTLFHSIFSDFEDEPLAAASLGQVHRARLHSNNVTVAIKLQRSRLRDIYDKDLALMQKLAKGVDTFAGKVGQIGGVKQSWEDIFQDAEEILYREIDYRDEANNAMRFASDFGIGVDGKSAECTAKSLDGKVLPSAAKWIRTPYIYDNYSTEKILVMEYVPSIKISNNKELAANGVTVRDREFLAECLARAYLRQFCVNKFFSTDPHPGNLGVELIENDKGERKPRLVFYDFGQACYLKDDQAGGILDVIEGIIDSNVDNCVNAFIRMVSFRNKPSKRFLSSF